MFDEDFEPIALILLEDIPLAFGNDMQMVKAGVTVVVQSRNGQHGYEELVAEGRMKVDENYVHPLPPENIEAGYS